MLVVPPVTTLRKDGWWIVVRQLGATYEFGPFAESPPATLTVHGVGPQLSAVSDQPLALSD